MQRTTLYPQHLAAGAKMVDFANWEMPIHYGSQLEEHHAVRTDAGMFDVSHMVVLDVVGKEAKPYLQYLLANDVAKLTATGKALYSCMLNTSGGIIDDLIVYFLSDSHYRIVVNAGTREQDIAWMQQQLADFEVTLKERSDLCILAIQGPSAHIKIQTLFNAEQAKQVTALKPFFAVSVGSWFVARTGYTGEDGFEMMIPKQEIAAVWGTLIQAGVRPAGLGARDTLRLEAGMNLYGTDMDTSTSPLTSGLTWTIAWQPDTRDFIGRAALEAEKAAGVKQQFVGLVLEGKGVLRSHMKVITSQGEGETTSGTFSPTLKLAIALARIPVGCDEQCQVEIRGKLLPARIVKPSFVRHGASLL